MATTQRQLILDDLKTDLETITADNGYKTNIQMVEVRAKGRDDLSDAVRPYLGIIPQQDQQTYYPFGSIRIEMALNLIGVIAAPSVAERQAALDNLIDDVTHCIAQDPTRGGNATDTYIVSTQTDEADPDSENDGQVLFDMRITYHRTTTKV